MMTKDVQPPQSKQVEKMCDTCIHVRTCKAFAMAVSMTKAFHESNDFVRLLADPRIIAKGCTEYISPIPESKFGV